MLVIMNITGASFAKETKGGLTWYTDLEEAHRVSQKENKPVFGFFTGSDWCGWCIKLQREVFAKEAFISWAKTKVVLLELDFPRKKQLSPAQKQQNQNLQRALGVTGYPTVWIFDTMKNKDTGGFEIKPFGKLGYPSGAVKGQEEVKFLENAKNVMAKRK